MVVQLVTKVFRGSLGRVLADASARVWVGILSFALLPFYLKLIGPESFGVLSAFASIQAIIALFDCSLAPTLTRELARARATNTEWERIKNLSRTMEVIYWCLAIIAGIIFCILVPLISHNWLNPEQLSAENIKSSLYIAAVALVFQWPSTIYSGGLVGLEKQKKIATINVFVTTFRAIISILALKFISPTVETLFYISVIFGVSQTFYIRHLFWSSMPVDRKTARFQSELLSDIWKFAVGVSIVTLSSVLLLQADKITLSKLLKLENFGYYTISVSIANALFIVTGALFSVMFPKFSELVASQRKDDLKRFYHLACQGVVGAILPASIAIAFYSHEVLFVWTKNPTVADKGLLILSVYIIGNVFNCLMSIPYTVMLAFGLTRVSAIPNVIAILIAFPLIYGLFQIVGPVSGPLSWLITNFGLVATSAVVVHKRFLQGEGSKWFWADNFLPILACIAVVAVFKFMVPVPEGRGSIFAMLVCVWVLASLATLAALPDLRRKLLEILMIMIETMMDFS